MLDIVLPELIMLIIGVLYRFFPPGHINDLHGYRSKRSKISKRLWLMGNRMSGMMFIISALSCFSIALLMYSLNVPGVRLINLLLTIFAAIIVVLWTEYRLEKEINKEG